jgi:hypothetical protein
MGADKSLARPGRKKATATEDFEFHMFYVFINIIGEILVLFIYITRLASNKIHREVGRAKDLSTLLIDCPKGKVHEYDKVKHE